MTPHHGKRIAPYLTALLKKQRIQEVAYVRSR